MTKIELPIETAHRILAALRAERDRIVHRMVPEARSPDLAGFQADAILREEIEKDINELANRITAAKLRAYTGRRD